MDSRRPSCSRGRHDVEVFEAEAESAAPPHAGSHPARLPPRLRFRGAPHGRGFAVLHLPALETTARVDRPPRRWPTPSTTAPRSRWSATSPPRRLTWARTQSLAQPDGALVTRCRTSPPTSSARASSPQHPFLLARFGLTAMLSASASPAAASAPNRPRPLRGLQPTPSWLSISPQRLLRPRTRAVAHVRRMAHSPRRRPIHRQRACRISRPSGRTRHHLHAHPQLQRPAACDLVLMRRHAAPTARSRRPPWEPSAA